MFKKVNSGLEICKSNSKTKPIPEKTGETSSSKTHTKTLKNSNKSRYKTHKSSSRFKTHKARKTHGPPKAFKWPLNDLNLTKSPNPVTIACLLTVNLIQWKVCFRARRCSQCMRKSRPNKRFMGEGLRGWGVWERRRRKRSLCPGGEACLTSQKECLRVIWGIHCWEAAICANFQAHSLHHELKAKKACHRSPAKRTPQNNRKCNGNKGCHTTKTTGRDCKSSRKGNKNRVHYTWTKKGSWLTGMGTGYWTGTGMRFS